MSRPRRVGFGMKPRDGSSSDAGQNESTAAVVETPEVDEIDETSVETGQEVVPEEGVEGAESPEKSEGGLELSPVQILDSEQGETAAGPSEEVIVARLPVFEPLPAVPTGIIDDLNKMLEESKCVAAAEEAPYIPTPAEEHGVAIGTIQEAYQSAKFTNAPGGISISAEEAAKLGYEQPGGYDIKFEPKIDAVQVYQSKAMGLLPTGDTRTTVLVREGYWEGVVSAAEADNQTVEEWLTMELASRLEDRFYGRR